MASPCTAGVGSLLVNASTALCDSLEETEAISYDWPYLDVVREALPVVYWLKIIIIVPSYLLGIIHVSGGILHIRTSRKSGISKANAKTNDIKRDATAFYIFFFVQELIIWLAAVNKSDERCMMGAITITVTYHILNLLLYRLLLAKARLCDPFEEMNRYNNWLWWITHLFISTLICYSAAGISWMEDYALRTVEGFQECTEGNVNWITFLVALFLDSSISTAALYLFISPLLKLAKGKKTTTYTAVWRNTVCVTVAVCSTALFLAFFAFTGLEATVRPLYTVSEYGQLDVGINALVMGISFSRRYYNETCSKVWDKINCCCPNVEFPKWQRAGGRSKVKNNSRKVRSRGASRQRSKVNISLAGSCKRSANNQSSSTNSASSKTPLKMKPHPEKKKLHKQSSGDTSTLFSPQVSALSESTDSLLPPNPYTFQAYRKGPRSRTRSSINSSTAGETSQSLPPAVRGLEGLRIEEVKIEEK